MTRTIVAIRPEPGLSATVEAAADLGMAIEPIPMSQVRALEWDFPDLEPIDGLLVGSANAFRHGGANLDRLKHLPVYAVGQATAEAAVEAGFAVELTGSGGLQRVIDTLTGPHSFLRLAGEERIALTLPDGISMVERIAYRMVTLPLPDAARKLLDHDVITLLHSANAAEHFARECARLGLAKHRIALAALGPRIATAAGPGWQSVHIAERPNDADLLAMVRDMWQ